MASGDRARPEGAEKPEDAVRKLLHLRKAMARARAALAADGAGSAGTASSPRVAEAIAEIQAWEDALEQVRGELADLIAERDRWRIAHDKLRERIDHHAMQPRTEADQPPRSAKIPTPRAQSPSGQSQDFSAIDRELERLNASMLAAFSSE